jgi:hypothetical protein
VKKLPGFRYDDCRHLYYAALQGASRGNPEKHIDDVKPHAAAKKAKNIMAKAACGRWQFLIANLNLTNCESSAMLNLMDGKFPVTNCLTSALTSK